MIPLKISLLFLLATLSICKAQNLVPNPSFEDTVFCPWAPSLIHATSFWEGYRESPDYFTTCASSMPYPAVSVGIPSNTFGYQFPFEGNSYTGLGTYTEDYLFREYLGVQLIHPLIPGQKYFVSCYISRAGAYSWDTFNGSGASNNFGFRFSMQPYSLNNPCPIDNSSHYHDTTLVSDSINWTKISFSFEPDTTYQYLILGNFYHDLQTDTLNIRDDDTLHTNFAYYYVDYVCVSVDSLCSVSSKISDVSVESNLNVFPNPFSNELNISYSSSSEVVVILYNEFGIFQNKNKFVRSLTMSTEDLNPGFYFYEIRIDNIICKRGKLIKR